MPTVVNYAFPQKRNLRPPWVYYAMLGGAKPLLTQRETLRRPEGFIKVA